MNGCYVVAISILWLLVVFVLTSVGSLLNAKTEYWSVMTKNAKDVYEP